MVAQEGACVVCNDIPSNEAMSVSKVAVEKPAFPTPDKDSGIEVDTSETAEEQSPESTPTDSTDSDVISKSNTSLSSLEDEGDRQRAGKGQKGFTPAPDLLRHTAVGFWPARLEFRCCEDCGHCAAYLSTQLGVNWLDGWDWYCPRHWSGNDGESEVSAARDDGIRPADWDEVEEVADEWSERLLSSGRLALGPKNTVRRTKGSGKISRPRGLVTEETRRERRIAQNGLQLASSTMLTRGGAKHDVTSRGKAKQERLAEAVAAKKANIEDRLRRSNHRRRGPPTIADRPRGEPQKSKSKAAADSRKRVKFELKEEDATRFAASDEEAELLRVLALLQHRDLLPEDYDLLLRLDEKIAKRTVGSGRLRTLRTRCLSDEDTAAAADGNSELAGARCAVCMEGYRAGQVVKWLPCQHLFHSNCIDTWLSNSSSVCPLDGTEV